MTRCSPERDAEITRQQSRIRTHEPGTSGDYRGRARWWELEAERGYPSSETSRRYARNMRWAAELAGLFGPGAWLDLLQRSGHPNPETTEHARRSSSGAAPGYRKAT